MPKANKTIFGALAPKYGFMVNPYPEFRVSKCPVCERATGQRKVPLLIHVAPEHMIALNYTCRYCAQSDLLVAHKQEVEHLLCALFARLDPRAIGNDYLILGTLDTKTWRESLTHPLPVAEMRRFAHDFKRYYDELRMTQGGWFPRDIEPPIAIPPESQEWVKTNNL